MGSDLSLPSYANIWPQDKNDSTNWSIDSVPVKQTRLTTSMKAGLSGFGAALLRTRLYQRLWVVSAPTQYPFMVGVPRFVQAK
jgi:hypothetical protein